MESGPTEERPATTELPLTWKPFMLDELKWLASICTMMATMIKFGKTESTDMGSRATTKRTQPAITEGVSPSPRKRCEEGHNMCVQHYTRNVRSYMQNCPLYGTLDMKG